jgi:hypothetical protein
MSYDPSSENAMFAKILQKLDTQDSTLSDIKGQVYKTNGRVDSLENDRWYQRGIVATIGLGASFVWSWFSHRAQ